MEFGIQSSNIFKLLEFLPVNLKYLLSFLYTTMKKHIIDKNDMYVSEKDIEKLELIDPKIALLNNKAGVYAVTTNEYLEKSLIKVGMSYNLRNRLLSYGLYYPLQKVYLLAVLVHSGKTTLGRGNSVYSIEQEVFQHFKDKLFYFPMRPNYTEWIRFEDKADIKPEITAKFKQINDRLKASTELIFNFDDANFNKEVANRVPRQLDIIEVLDFHKQKYNHPAQVLVKFAHLREDVWVNLETVYRNRKVQLYLVKDNPRKKALLEEKFKAMDEHEKDTQVYKEMISLPEKLKKQAEERDVRHRKISAMLANKILTKSMDR